MSLDKKIELVYYDEKLIPIRVGYSIGTVYTMDPEDNHRFKLYDVGYCPSTKDFYYNRGIHLPKKLIEYFESGYHNPEFLKKEMEEIGIYRKNAFTKLFEDYNNAQVQTELIREKTLSLKRGLKAKK